MLAKQQLVEDNMNLVYHIINKNYPTYVNDEDIVQCGMLGLCKAADSWDESKSQFSTFACRCIQNEIAMEFRRRAKHQGILSLDYEVDDGDGGRTSFGDFIVGDEDVDYQDVSIDANKLTPRELQVYELCKTGMTYADIGRKLGITKQRVWKISRKLRALRG